MNVFLLDVGSTFIKYMVYEPSLKAELFSDSVPFPMPLINDGVHYEISEEEINQYYNDFGTEFVEPETRDAEFVVLSTEDIAKHIEKCIYLCPDAWLSAAQTQHFRKLYFMARQPRRHFKLPSYQC